MHLAHWQFSLFHFSISSFASGFDPIWSTLTIGSSMITFQQSFGTAWVGFDYECNFTTFVTLNMFVYYQEDFHVDRFWELNGQPCACQYMTKTNTEEGIITFSSLPVLATIWVKQPHVTGTCMRLFGVGLRFLNRSLRILGV